MKKLTIALLLLLSLCIALPALADLSIADLDFEAEVVITHSTNVSIRRRADSDSDRLGWAKPYESFPYMGETNGWFRLSYNNRPGFVSNDLSKAMITENNNTRFVLITHWNNTKLRSWKSTKSDMLGMAAPGTVLPYLGEEDGWYRVLYCGRTAYISTNVSEVIDDAVGMYLGTDSSAYD